MQYYWIKSNHSTYTRGLNAKKTEENYNNFHSIGKVNKLNTNIFQWENKKKTG